MPTKYGTFIVDAQVIHNLQAIVQKPESYIISARNNLCFIYYLHVGGNEKSLQLACPLLGKLLDEPSISNTK